MAKTYLAEKSEKKKKAMTGVYVVVIIAIIFIFVIVKFALSGNKYNFSSGMPSSDDAYNIAIELVRPTVKNSADFPETGYQFGKKADSVYIIKSYFDTKDETGEKSRKNYEIILKYNGGSYKSTNNWSIVSLDTNQ